MRSHLAGLLLLASPAGEAPTAERHGLRVEDLRDLTLRTDRNLYEATFSGGEGTYRMYPLTLVGRFTNGTDQALYLSRSCTVVVRWCDFSRNGESLQV